MPRLTIDDIPVEAPAGTSVLEAAKQAGIWIPHFCYHPALGQAGACRLCAVTFREGPVKGTQMSCMIPAQDGMVVDTADPEAARLRSLVIEWLMTNHPLDCPVCDEGGECLLQDYTVAGGHGVRRYRGKKRTFRNQDLGPHIVHEMNRCIECYRCVRFYQEYAGGTDLGAMGSAGRVYFGRFRDGTLESPFSGNLLDICPTGVYTDKAARFKARYWDYELAPSICPHCSLGCATVPAVRYRELVKVMARRSDPVNGWFICDRGRFGNGDVGNPDRPRVPVVDGREVTLDEALEALLERVGELGELYGEGSVAVVGSSRLPLEGAVLLPLLARLLEAGFLCFFAGEAVGDRTLAAVSSLHGGNRASQADVRGADAIAVVGCDLLEEAPMLALAVRQAWRNGARIYGIGETDREMLSRAMGFEVEPHASLEQFPPVGAVRPLIVCGTGKNGPAVIEAAAGRGVRTVFPLAGPNACGAALVSREHRGTSLEAALATGRVRGVIAVEADIPEEMLEGIRFVARIDWRGESAGGRSDILIPSACWLEADGTFVNNEGRAQRFSRIAAAGIPVRGLPERYHGSEAKPGSPHPPHVHRAAPPGGGLLPSWRILADLSERLGEPAIDHPLSGRWEPLRHLNPDGEGCIVLTGEP